jgi:hypothetical protein
MWIDWFSRGQGGAELAAGLLPGGNSYAPFQQSDVKLWQKAAASNLIVSGAICAQSKDPQSASAPEPHLGHAETAVKLKLVDPAAGQRNLQHQVGELPFPAQAP